jgi:hypothetical protein
MRRCGAVRCSAGWRERWRQDGWREVGVSGFVGNSRGREETGEGVDAGGEIPAWCASGADGTLQRKCRVEGDWLPARRSASSQNHHPHHPVSFAPSSTPASTGATAFSTLGMAWFI